MFGFLNDCGKELLVLGNGEEMFVFGDGGEGEGGEIGVSFVEEFVEEVVLVLFLGFVLFMFMGLLLLGV